jgi:hypothetical protein
MVACGQGRHTRPRPAVWAALRCEAPAGPGIIVPRRPTRVDLTGPGSTDVVDTLVVQTEDQADDVVAALQEQARQEGGDV